ncbi:MAG: DUF6762 family protein [Sedimentibacter sp.]|uniref:DUF6762 family protein n=1 Tax=Sedimentibacter sp. TaxID=1960295 RepID=UPI003157F387
MDNYNNLVLMLKDSQTGFFDSTVGSYEIPNHMEYIDKIYAVQEGDGYYIYLTLTTHEIEEDWKYSGLFDLYDHDVFSERIVEIEELSGDFNPKWILKIQYSENHKQIEELLNEILNIHVEETERIIPLINPDDYTEETEE